MVDSCGHYAGQEQLSSFDKLVLVDIHHLFHIRFYVYLVQQLFSVDRHTSHRSTLKHVLFIRRQLIIVVHISQLTMNDCAHILHCI